MRWLHGGNQAGISGAHQIFSRENLSMLDAPAMGGIIAAFLHSLQDAAVGKVANRMDGELDARCICARHDGGEIVWFHEGKA